MVSNVFRKGYQWPYHSTRMLDYRSSLLDLAVFLERQAGRRVYLDFLRNPDPVNPGESFSLDDLDADVRAYLENNDALDELPIDRLRRMNPLAIELYRMHGTDVASEPLEFAMNNQHMNGGIKIDDWGKTNLQGCYAIGEAAGSHGVTRPGGSALNSGQVFGKRAAVAIKRSHKDRPERQDETKEIIPALQHALAEAKSFVEDETGLAPKEVKSEIQARMSDHAGMICHGPEVKAALEAAHALRKQVEEVGFSVNSPAMVAQAFRWRHMAYVSEAVLSALDYYISNGGGSRGARAICSDSGTRCPEAYREDLSRFRFIEEQPKDKAHRLVVCFEAGQMQVKTEPVHTEPDTKREFFEKGWGSYLIKEA
jgi:hypothetical protein